jgi:arylsulfatase A-like enzyme
MLRRSMATTSPKTRHSPARDPGKSRWTSLLIAIVLAVGAGFLLMHRPDVERLVPLTQHSRIPLVLRLPQAEQVDGFPVNQRWIEPLYSNSAINVDDPHLPIAMPQTGTIRFPDLPLHSAPTIEFAYGVEQVLAPAGQGTVVEFEVVAARRESGEERQVFRGEAVAGSPGALPVRHRASAPLPAEWVGGRIDLRFSTRTRAALPDLTLIPAFASPVLVSSGVESRVADLAFDRELLLADLLDRFAAAVERDDELETLIPGSTSNLRLFATRTWPDGRVDELLQVQRARVPAFDAGERQDAERPGVWPALLFGFDGTVVRYELEIPRGGARLEAEIAVERRCVDVGAAVFRVLVDGAMVFERWLDPRHSPADRGWHPVSVDLAPFAGKRIVLELAGELSAEKPAVVRRGERRAPLAPEEIVEYRVEQMQAAFGIPRIVAGERESRRLASKRDPQRPSVILVNVETLRSDALGCYGGDPAVTPNLDRLARDGTLVDPCLTVAPWTSPSVASLFTGLYPYGHGVTSYAESFLAETVETLAERAQAAGVTTFGIVTNDLLSPRKNFDQGFETHLTAPYANARQVVATFGDWLVDHGDLQFFAYLHLFEPHDPCNAPGDDRERFVPPELRGRDDREALSRLQARLMAGESIAESDDDVRLLRGRYLGEVHYADRQIGALREMIEKRGLAGRVVLIVTGDHGEEFLEHGSLGHGLQVYDESIAVPLLFFGPGVVKAAHRIEGPVENRRLYASVLDLLGAEYERGSAGAPLDLAADKQVGEAYVTTEQGLRRIAFPDLFSKTIHKLRSRTESFVFTPSEDAPDRGENGATEGAGVPREAQRFEHYDLESDPGEQRGTTPEGERLTELKRRLRRAYEFAVRERHGLDVSEVDSATAATIQQLGYMSSSASNRRGKLFDDD